MNKVYLMGTIENVEYRLVDKGKIYAIAIIDLKIKKNIIKLICKNDEADYAYRFFKTETRIMVEGVLRNTKNNYVVFVKNIEIC